MTIERIVHPWDPENRYPFGFLREYQHWCVEISYLQHTLGSLIVFCKRKIENFSELNTDELVEYVQILQKIEQVLLNAFGCRKINCFQMGNKLHWLHVHIIPRHESTIEFGDQIWVDENYGNPPVWTARESSHELVGQIRDVLYSSFYTG